MERTSPALHSFLMPQWLNLPNSLTLVRLLMVPAIIRAILHGEPALALALFAVAAFTDFLDGYAARQFGGATSVGAYLDPIADKILISGVFVAMAVAGIFPSWLVVLIFGRDVCILAGAVLAMRLTPVRRFPPSVWGKVSTFVQIVTAVVWMAQNLLSISLLQTAASVTLWLCAGFTVWSGLHYTWRGLRMVHAH